MDTPAYITIEHCVLSYLNETGEYSLDDYDRFVQIVLEGYSDLNMNHVYAWNHKKIPVNSVGQVKFPSDLIRYHRIGIVEDGKIWTLTKNDDIAIPVDEVCGFNVGDPDNLKEINQPNWHDPTQAGGWNFGKYRIDLKNRMVILDGDLSGYEIAFEYTSTGVSLEDQTFVPRDMLNVLKKYLNSIIKEANGQLAENKKERAHWQFYWARRDFINKRNAFTYDELLDAIRSGYSMGVKR